MALGAPTLPALAIAASAGLAVGVGGYAFWYAKGASYLGNDPRTCANCHVMERYYEAWQQGSHHAVATCNDCHTPSGPMKYVVKAENGLYHSMMFTLGDYPENIRARDESRAVVEGQCRHCHQQILASMQHVETVSCVRCHDSVGHLR